MFTHSIDPVIFSIGSLQIRYYGLSYIIGFLLVYWILYKAAEEKKIKNFTKKLADDFILWAILGVVMGGRIGYFLFYSPNYFWQDPFEIIKVWQGGMSFHGGLIGVCLAGYWFVKKHKLSFYELADTVAMPAVVAFGIVRIANFINAEIVGTRTNLPWCVNFPNFEGCRHPAQIYLSLKNFAVAGFLCFLSQKDRKPGFLFWNMMFWYGLGRFIIEFVRLENRFFGVSMGQYLTLAMILISAWMLHKDKF